MFDTGILQHQTPAPRIVLIHATRLAIEPIEAAFSTQWPEAEAISILEEALSIDRSRSDFLGPDFFTRIGWLTDYGEKLGARGILFTCSSFTSAIEHAATLAKVPVLKPNEAMFEDAMDFEGPIALVHTFAPAAAGMVEEFHSQRGDLQVDMQAVFCEGALSALSAGDAEGHDRLIAECVAGLGRFKAIAFAQFSMARAAALSRKRTEVPILTSPESAVEKMKSRVGELEC